MTQSPQANRCIQHPFLNPPNAWWTCWPMFFPLPKHIDNATLEMFKVNSWFHPPPPPSPRSKGPICPWHQCSWEVIKTMGGWLTYISENPCSYSRYISRNVGITTIVLQLRKLRGSFRTFKKRVLEIFFARVGFLEDVLRWWTGSNLCGSSPILCHQLPSVGKPRAATTRPMTLQGNWDSWLYNFLGEGMSCICPQLPPQGWAHKFMLGHWNSLNQLSTVFKSDRDDTQKKSLGSPRGSWFFIVSNWSNERTQVPCEKRGSLEIGDSFTSDR